MRPKRTHKVDEYEQLKQSVVSELELIEAQISDLKLDNFGSQDEKSGQKMTAHSKYGHILAKKEDLGLFSKEPKTNQTVKDKFEALSTDLELKKAKLQRFMLAKKKNIEICKSSIIQKIKEGRDDRAYLATAIKMVRLEEQLKLLEKHLKFFERCLESILKVTQITGNFGKLVSNFDYTNDFLASEFNEKKIQARLLFDDIFRQILRACQANSSERNFTFEKMAKSVITHLKAENASESNKRAHNTSVHA